MIVGANLYDNGVTDEGAAFLYYGCGSGCTPTGRDIVVVPIDSATGTAPVTITFDSVAVEGITTLEIIDNGPPPPSGFQLTKPKTYYYLTTTATFVGSLEVCVNYKGMVVGKQEKLQLEHYVAEQWDACTSYHDFADSIICCDNLSSLSPFAILEPIPQYAIDIHPRSCPNPFNIKWLENIDNGKGNENSKMKKGGVMPAAIVGSESFDVTEINVSALLLEGVAPLRSSYEDVTRTVSSSEACACTTGGPDGFMDLTLKFSRQEIAATIGPAEVDDVIENLVQQVQSAGDYVVEWNASHHASGIYFYRIEVGNFTDTRKLILLK